MLSKKKTIQPNTDGSSTDGFSHSNQISLEDNLQESARTFHFAEIMDAEAVLNYLISKVVYTAQKVEEINRPVAADGSSQRNQHENPFSVPFGTGKSIPRSFAAYKPRFEQLLDIDKYMEYLREHGKITAEEYADYSAKFTDLRVIR